MSTTVEDSFARLQLEFTQKQAEIRALGVQQNAAAQRLDDNLRREAESQVALKEVGKALDEARKDLAQARRDAAKILAAARADANRIQSEAHVAADGFLRGVTSAVQAAASLIPKRKEK
jgi:hypothetical protein